MTRPLHVVPGDDPLELVPALREALSGTGAAVLPRRGQPSPADGGPVPRQVAVVVETSGSTGDPKRVMLSTNALLAAAAASSVALGGAGQWLLALPVHYIAGIQVLIRSIAAETTPVVLPAGHFDPVVFAEHAQRLTEPLRFTSVVPVQLARLLDAAETRPDVLAVLRRFTGVLVGGQAVQPELAQRAAQQDVRLVRTYGSSETAGGCVYNGAPIGDTAVRVVDGLLEVSGSVLAEGYLGDPRLTAERFIDEHGARWYRTGDEGSVDPSTGLVRVLGRADNVIISGGEKVSLDAVERVVSALPGLGGAVVVAGEDPAWGQVPVVMLEGGPAPELEQVRRAVADVLGPAARPDRIVIVASMPRLPSGKPDRGALREHTSRPA